MPEKFAMLNASSPYTTIRPGPPGSANVVTPSRTAERAAATASSSSAPSGAVNSVEPSNPTIARTEDAMSLCIVAIPSAPTW